MERRSLQSTLRIVLLYALFGMLWITASDRVLELLVADPHRITVIQTYKGWGFVFASAVVIYFAARRELLARERAERRVKESEEKYRALIENANDAILVFDADAGLVIEANKRAVTLLGLPAEKLVGLHYSQLHPPEDSEQCRRFFEDAVRQGALVTDALCVFHVDGRKVPVEISTNSIDVGGRKIVQSIFRDITERKRAEETLEREKNRAQKYLDIAGVFILVIGADEKVSLINKKGAEILGHEEREIIGQNFFDSFIPERMRKGARSIFERLLSGQDGALAYFEFPVMTVSGEERILAWYNILVRDEHGRITGTLSSGEDITARKMAEEKARIRLERLDTLHAIDLIISSSLDLHITLLNFIDHVIAQFHVDAADVLLLNPHTLMLEYAAGRGFLAGGIERTSLRMGEGIAGVVAKEHRGIAIADLRDPGSGFLRSPLLAGEGFIAYYASPLLAKGRPLGVLEILHRSPLHLDDEQKNFLEALAAQAAIAIDNAALFDGLQRSNIELSLAYDATLEGWARALDLRSEATERHTERVTEMTMRLARAMGIGEKELVHIRRGALLHDIGKIAVPDSILMKAGPLTAEEQEIMRRHPVHAFEMLVPIAYLRPALDIPYCHHERWDGTGYPRGLRGERIPLAARIFTVADVWDALYATDRPYRKPLPRDAVREHIRSLAGTHLDPEAVEEFLKLEW